MENKEIRDKIVSAISGDGLGNFAKFALTESPFVDAIQNLTRKDEREQLLQQRINTYVAMRDKYATADPSMSYAYDTVVNDLLNMQLNSLKND